MENATLLRKALKWTFAPVIVTAGAVFGFFLVAAFQTSGSVPTASGSLDTNNDSRSYPFFTTAPANVYNRATMSFEAIKNNFTTLLADTATLKTTTNNIDTREALQECVAFPTAAGTTCPAGWTYASQVTIWTNKNNLCCK